MFPRATGERTFLETLHHRCQVAKSMRQSCDFRYRGSFSSSRKWGVRPAVASALLSHSDLQCFTPVPPPPTEAAWVVRGRPPFCCPLEPRRDTQEATPRHHR